MKLSILTWERKLLERFRQLRNAMPGEFFVLVHFTSGQVILRLVNKPERIVENGSRLTDKN